MAIDLGFILYLLMAMYALGAIAVIALAALSVWGVSKYMAHCAKKIEGTKAQEAPQTGYSLRPHAQTH